MQNAQTAPVCDTSASLAYTLPAHYYTSADVFELEKKTLFSKSWVCVMHKSQVAEPNAYATARVAGENVFVVRGRDGVLRGFYNVCPHRAHELFAEGSGRAKNVITCPYHAWAFGLDGKVIHVRNSENVPGFCKENAGLTPVRVEEFCGLVFVNLDMDAVPLAELAAGLNEEIRSRCPDVDKLVPAHRLTYEMKANWKVVVDNYLECLHCQTAHPALVESIRMETYKHEVRGIYTSQVGQTRSDSDAFNYGDEAAHTEFAAFWLWPNVTINVLPGDGNYGVFYMFPVDADTTIQHFEFYFRDSTPTAEQEQLIEYYKNVLKPEDLSIVESVQRGLKSRGYRNGQGPLLITDDKTSAIGEHGVQHFQQMVLGALA
ncbi:aromatic ring-hydroxylating oxygenase subunit alpha [Crenobacter cavernae]|uniref:Ring-hydroxylating oxygenase subunit alpha n=1 Tax=Crenobacter cavernae TaxID=2290923 RepID=A0ABY0FCM5_9NEIS|nr:ring-hydroxylating oxygenase subunit alpha [Crenobacter cavernae]RXZ43882.1 ring-hydroxylating oxygenase subunit alpha [Crenobacter cavernae]